MGSSVGWPRSRDVYVYVYCVTPHHTGNGPGSNVAVAQDVREERLEVREVRHVLTVVHHSQLTCSAQVRWKDPSTAINI